MAKAQKAVDSAPETPTVEEAAAEWVDVDSLVAWPDNPKKPTPAEIKGVVASIKKFGFGAPVVARRENLEVIAGHTRLQAAKKCGLTRVPVRLMDLSEHDAHILALADNELGADWDLEMLRETLATIEEGERVLAGWSDKEFLALCEKEAPVSEELLGANGYEHSSQFGVIVMASSESEQERIFNELTTAGHNCKVVCV